MRLAVDAKSGQWIKATNQAEKVMAKALTTSMRQVGKLAVAKGRERITAAGFSSGFARTLVALNKPKTGYVLNPRVWIHTTVNYADVFEKGKTISGAIGGRAASPYLWLPFPEVPPNPGSGVRLGGLVHRQHMTPAQYVRKIGPLITVQRRGKLPLLAAIVEGPATKPTAGRLRRTAQRRLLRATAFARKKQTHLVFLFYAVRQITIPQKFDVDGAVDQVFAEFQDAYDTNVRPDEDIE